MTPTNPAPTHTLDFDPHGPNGPTTGCSCGWSFRHKRDKVRERAAARHLAKASEQEKRAAAAELLAATSARLDRLEAQAKTAPVSIGAAVAAGIRGAMS